MRLEGLRPVALVGAFFAVGAPLALVRRALAPEPGLGALTVRVRAGASEAERALARDGALLLAWASLAGFARSDAVVRERLIHGAGLVAPGLPPAELVARGLRLGLHEADPIARERLVTSARRALERPGPEPPPDPEEIAAAAAGAATEAAPEARVRIEPRFLSSARGGSLDADVAALQRALAGGASAPSDPSPVPRGWVTPARLDALAGPGVGARVSETPIGAWSPPIRGAHGVLVVRVLGREAGEVEPTAARAALLERVHAARRARRLRRALEALAARFDVRVEETP